MDVPQIFRKFRPPSNLNVVDTEGLTWEKSLAITSLQGIVNSEEPRVYQVLGPSQEHWLRYYEERFGVKWRRLDDPMELFRLYAGSLAGTVVYDPDVPDTANLAVTLAGLEHVVPATPTLADELETLGLSPARTLVGRFDDRLSAYRWAKEELLPSCSRHMIGSICVGKRRNWMQRRTPIIDYLVAHRAFVMHLSSARRDREENRLFDEVLEAAGGPGVLMGWHCARDKEKEYVSRAARRGFFVLCSSSVPNMTVHGGIPRVRERYVQRKPRALNRIREKVYVTLYLTDGDAIWAMENLQSQNWESDSRGSIPFNWGLLPLLYDIAPGMLEYYYETASENDYFSCPSSGAAYTYSYLHDDWYLRYSKRYMDLTGQVVANMVNWDTNFWWKEVEDPRAVYREKAMLKPVGLVCGLGGSVFAKSYPTGTPKVHAALVLHVGEDCRKRIVELAQGIRERPLFIFAFVQIAHGVLEHLVKNLKDLPAEVEILNMDTFMMSLRKAVREGLVGDELYPSKANLAQPLLIEPGRKQGAAALRLMHKLALTAEMPREEMERELNLGNWINLADRDPTAVEEEADKWRLDNEGYLPYDTPNLADALGYNLFYTVWAFLRARLNAAGRYANHMDSCLDEYLDLFPDPENAVLEEIWEMWRNWEEKPPELEAVKALCRRADQLLSKTGFP